MARISIPNYPTPTVPPRFPPPGWPVAFQAHLAPDGERDASLGADPAEMAAILYHRPDIRVASERLARSLTTLLAEDETATSVFLELTDLQKLKRPQEERLGPLVIVAVAVVSYGVGLAAGIASRPAAK